MAVESSTPSTQQTRILLEHYGFVYFNGRDVTWFQDDASFDKERALFTLLGGLFGACMAAPKGLILGKVIGLISGGPPGACLGCAIGGSTAFILGGIAGGYATYKLYPLFKIMRAAETSVLTTKQIEEIFLNHTIQNTTREDLPQAVRTPNNVIYEKKSLLRWLEKSATDPFMGSPLQESDLTDVGSEAIIESAKSVAAILSQKLNYLSTHCPELIPGYQALDAHYRLQCNLYFNAVLLRLQERLEKKELTEEEYRSEVQSALKEHFGQEYIMQ